MMMMEMWRKELGVKALMCSGVEVGRQGRMDGRMDGMVDGMVDVSREVSRWISR
jgi:hypothetical protein